MVPKTEEDHEFYRQFVRPVLYAVGADTSHIWLVIDHCIPPYGSYVYYVDRRGKPAAPDPAGLFTKWHQDVPGEETAEQWAERHGFTFICRHPRLTSIIRAETPDEQFALKMRWG